MKIFSHLAVAVPLLAAPVVLPTSAQAAPRTSVPARSWVALQATTDKARYTTGSPISVVLTATNITNNSPTPRIAYLRFTSGQRFDFSVYRAGTSESVYTWSATRMFMQGLGSLWLKPGQSQKYEAAVGDEMGALPAGKYILRARLANSPRPIEAPPVAFEIVAPAISMTANTNKTTYKIGEPVEISASATNTTSEARVLHFDSGLGCDFIVSDENGKQLWTYGANLRFIRALGDVTWNAGEKKDYSATWNGVRLPGEDLSTTIAPGRYQVQAVLQSTPQVLAPPVWITLVK